MILLPSSIKEEAVESARMVAIGKKDNPSLKNVVLEDFEEGCSAQITHIGPWAEEAENINRVKSFIKDKGGILKGKHHEIYMSDPRRVVPQKLRTVIRQPFS